MTERHWKLLAAVFAPVAAWLVVTGNGLALETLGMFTFLDDYSKHLSGVPFRFREFHHSYYGLVAIFTAVVIMPCYFSACPIV